MADAQPSIAQNIFHQPFTEQVAFFRQKLGNLVPTSRWTDMQKAAHDRGFMVAGAQKADLLSDLAAAVDRSITEGKSIQAFRKDFKSIVAQRGWTGWKGEGSKAGVAWRTRVIYKTNMTTSYAAGRLAQLHEGDFDLWVYHHNDSVLHPRPQHLAWNGLTLPKTHGFWSAHYPPGGWGCECYVTGARSRQGARRQGGNPDKALPNDWNKIDEKTGEPVGIDKGWGYQPGNTVTDTVQQMAQKTTQWEYTLAKAYMQNVPRDVRDQLARSYRSLPSVADDTRRYAQRVLNETTTAKVEPYRTLGLLTEDDVKKVERAKQVDTTNYDFAVDASTVHHIERAHGNDAIEGARGQRAVTNADFARLPEIVNNPDSVTDGGKSDIGRPIMRYSKTINGELYTAAFEIRKGRKMLALQSLWIRNAN